MDEVKKPAGDSTIKIRRATKNKFDELYGESGFANASMFMDELLEHWEYPIKENKELKDKEQQLKEVGSKMAERTAEIENLKKDVTQRDAVIEDLKKQITTLNQQLADQDSSHHAAIEELNAGYTSKREKALKDHILVPVTPLDRKCLEWMTDRERKERKRNDITVENFFMYVVKEMLIKGNKWSVDCVPDKVIRQFEQELKGKDNGDE